MGGKGTRGRTDAPARSVKVLARGPNGERELLELGRERRDARERLVVQAVVDLVGQNEDLLLDAQVANALELLAGVDLAERVV